MVATLESPKNKTLTNPDVGVIVGVTVLDGVIVGVLVLVGVFVGVLVLVGV
jgi:hypothetical protein